MLTMPGNEAPVQHNSVRELEYDQLLGQISQRPEGKWGMQLEPDNTGRPISWEENPLSATYHCIWLTVGQ